MSVFDEKNKYLSENNELDNKIDCNLIIKNDNFCVYEFYKYGSYYIVQDIKNGGIAITRE